MSNYFLTGLFRLRFLSLCTSHFLSNNGFAALAPPEKADDFSRASGPAQVPERRIIPPARARGCLTSHFWDEANLPASFHPSQNESHSIPLGSAIYSLLMFLVWRHSFPAVFHLTTLKYQETIFPSNITYMLQTCKSAYLIWTYSSLFISILFCL